MNEPSAAALGGNAPTAIIRRYFLATRPKFYPASILPVVVGTAWGVAAAGQIDLLAAVLALLATVAVHAGSNVINDVGDELNGTDRNNEGRIHPFTGGSRFIQNEVLTVRQMTVWGIALFVIATGLGALLISLKGIGVLYLGLAGVALAVLYSLPVVQLSGRGIGELAIAVAFGILPVCGAAWLQTGVIDLNVVLVSAPVSCWVAAILLINEVPDLSADESAGKRTWPVRFGLTGTRWIYFSLHVIALSAMIALVARQVFPWWALVVSAVLLVMGFRAATTIVSDDSSVLENGIKTTLAIHTIGALWLTAIIFIAA
jgi:1,4-dihydroxy-2-naphthoate octaprenyltransferase